MTVIADATVTTRNHGFSNRPNQTAKTNFEEAMAAVPGTPSRAAPVRDVDHTHAMIAMTRIGKRWPDENYWKNEGERAT